MFNFRLISTLVLTVLSLYLAFLAKQYPYFSIDLSFTKLIQSITLPGFETLMVVMTNLGNFPYSFILTFAIAGVLVKKNMLREGINVIASAVGISLVGFVIKFLVSRDRPDPSLVNQVNDFFRTESFPSGHVLFFIGIFGYLTYLTFTRMKNVLLKQALIAVYLVMIILMGLSRIYLGAHWLSDVIGAYLIGSLWLMVFLYVKKH